MIAYNEDAAPARIVLLAVLIGSIIGLRYVSAH
jgi:multidrug transporter EmrE-like cation transporter